MKWLVLVDEPEASESSSPIMALRDALIKVCCTALYIISKEPTKPLMVDW